MLWNGLSARIAWNRCKRRRWPSEATLSFSASEQYKRRHVLIYCWAGRGWRSTPSGRLETMPGSCFWSRPGWHYTAEQDPQNPLGLTAIHFDLVDPSGHVVEPGEVDLPPEWLEVQAPHLVETITTWIAELALDTRAGVGPDRSRQEAANTMFEGLLRQLCQQTESAQAGDGSQISWPEVTRFIQKTLHTAPRVQEVARHFGYTRSHFSRLFKQRTGLSPQSYIINARIELAKELLEETDQPINKVGFYSGYSDPYQFSKQFKKYAGVSPSQYRRTCRGWPGSA